MPPTLRRFDRGHLLADSALRDLGRELRSTRARMGLSQRTLGRAARMSHSEVSRLERGLVPNASLRSYSVLFAILGHKVVTKAYPYGSPLRDAGHVRLLRRFARLLPSGVSLETEIPLQRAGDLRSWDGQCCFPDGCCKIEAETVVTDVQATDRHIAGKMRDDGVERVILLVADTPRNREALRASREQLRVRFTLDGRQLLAAIRAGHCPPAGGILIL